MYVVSDSEIERSRNFFSRRLNEFKVERIGVISRGLFAQSTFSDVLAICKKNGIAHHKMKLDARGKPSTFVYRAG